MDNNVNTKEQNPEMNSGSLHDVPLSNEEQDEKIQNPISKIPSKNGSLKRFFKLSSHKKGGAIEKNTETDAGDLDADNEDEDAVKQTNDNNHDDPDDLSSEQAVAKPQSLRRERSRRFNFRFGSNSAEGDNPTSSNNPPAASRHSLRSSLSTYFNSVFKRKQGANSKHTLRTDKKKDDAQENDGENENSIEMVEQKLLAPENQQLKKVETKEESTNTLEEQPPNISIPEEITPTATPPQA